MGNDDHIERITRLYSDNIETEYEGAMRYLSGSSIKDESLCIDIIEKDFVSIFNTIVKKLNYNDKYASKLLSSFRLYFDLIPNNDFERNIVTYTTILETLLLNKDEDCQRKKVSVRAACLINDGGDKKDKQIFSTKIYQFYKYRHNIVHDGASFDDLGNEYLVHKEMGFVRHIIYFVIKEIINRNVKGIEEIINIVKNNMEIDGLSNSFNYIEILD